MGNSVASPPVVDNAPQRSPWEEDIILDIVDKIQELGYPTVDDDTKLKLLQLMVEDYDQQWSEVDQVVFHPEVAAVLGMPSQKENTLTPLSVDKYLTQTGIVTALPENLDKFLARFLLQSLGYGFYWKLPGTPPEGTKEIGSGSLSVVYEGRKENLNLKLMHFSHLQ